MWILLPWGYSGFQVKRMVKELFLGGLNFLIRDFLGWKIWQGVGIFNRWLDLSRFFFPRRFMVVPACLELLFCIITVIVETEDVLGCLKC